MTREEEIKKAAANYCEVCEPSLSKCGDYSFTKGAEWADNNPKSPWKSVKDDLPYKHKELLLSTRYHTVSVFTYKKGGACGIDSMINRNGKWGWEAWKENYLYWMPIPNLPKE